MDHTGEAVDDESTGRHPWRKPTVVVLDVPTRTRSGQYDYFFESVFTDVFRLPS